MPDNTTGSPVTTLNATIRRDQRVRLENYAKLTGKISTSEALRDVLDRFFSTQETRPDPAAGYEQRFED